MSSSQSPGSMVIRRICEASNLELDTSIDVVTSLATYEPARGGISGLSNAGRQLSAAVLGCRFG